MIYHQIFKPSQELTFATVVSDSARIQQVLRDIRITHLFIDLEHVTYCDSAGLALLVETKKRCQHYGVTMNVQAPSDAVHALVEFCGLGDLLRYS